MTVAEAFEEIDRRWPRLGENYLADVRRTKSLPKTEMAYWYYRWDRIEKEGYHITETIDTGWQNLGY